LSSHRLAFDTRVLRSLCALAFGALWLMRATSVHAQTTSETQSEQNLLNWYYGAVFGTGVYTAGDRTVSILQIPFSQQLKPPSADEWGLRVVVPVSFGFYDFKFDQLLEGETPKSVGTVSIFPGLEAQIPVTSNWRLKPYANVGWGWDLSGGGGALIYAGGIKSLFALPVSRSVEVSLGNQLTLAGYSPEGASNQPLGVFVAGVNVETVTDMRLADRPLLFGTHLIYYYYFNRLRFPTADDPQNKISEQGQIAFSLSVKKAIDFSLFDLDRIALGYTFGGGVRGISLFFSLPY